MRNRDNGRPVRFENDKFNLTGRTALQKRNATVAVIGAGDFIGSEIAKKFASEGFTVFAGRRNGAKLEPLVKEIEAAGGEIHARSLDARKEEEIISFLETPTSTRRSKSASSTSAPTSISRFWKPPSGCSARSGKWPAIPVSSPAARPRA